jgi:hypothetical protein
VSPPLTLVLVLSVLLPVLAGVPDGPASAQQLTQTIRGTVVDATTRSPLPGANVVLLDHEPLIGTVTTTEGRFVLERVPLGRRSLRISFLGYESSEISNLVVTSGREVQLEVALREQVIVGEDVVVTAEILKDQPINRMVLASARSLSVEATRRYAGGLDDPARMASAFAGVTSTGGVQENALVIRGNSPKGVQWRLEGVEIPNPNHFAGMTVAGGGGLTLFSSHLLADADFLTGAFPAEYGNALAGVFDMRFRAGNRDRYEHALQIGIIGIEAASEGPVGGGSYLFNYRYSTLGLLMPLLPTDALPTYQDLSFKVALPTGRASRLEAWGIGGLDTQRLSENLNRDEWEYDFWDRTRFELGLGVGAAGLSHHLLLGDRSYLRTSAAITVNRTKWDEERLDDGLVLQPNVFLRSTSGRLIGSTELNHRFSARHSVRTGLTVQNLFYDLSLDVAPGRTPPVQRIAGGSGSSILTQGFWQSNILVGRRLQFTAGIRAQHFALTERTTIEPRLSGRYALDETNAFSAGYGLHSQIEDIRIYLVRGGAEDAPAYLNRDLAPTRAHHAVLGYHRRLGQNARLTLETYHQHLFDVPVVADSTYSMLNFEQDWTFDLDLTNDGLGRNYGLELTLERFLSGGWYYLATGSVFRSEYRGGDHVWRPTRYDQRFGGNLLAGKEWNIGSRGNLLGVNGRVILMGGRRMSPVDHVASRERQDVIFDEAAPFTRREPTSVIADLTVTYRINRRRFSEAWALQVKNIFAAADRTHDYNYQLGDVEEVREGFPLPVLSWKIEF